MTAILRTIRANLRTRKGQTWLVFLTLTAAVLLLTVALIGYFSGYHVYDRLMERTHGAHIWLEADPKMVTAKELSRAVHANPEVVEATEAMATFRAALETANGGNEEVFVRDLNPGRKIARLLWVEGSAPRPGSAEIAIDRNMAHYLGMHVGEKVKVWIGKTPNEFTVTGTFITSEFCAYPDCKPPHAYLGPGTLAAAMKKHGVSPDSWDVGIRIRDPRQADAVLKELRQAFPVGAVEGYTWLLARRFAGFSQQIQSVFVLVFAVMSALVAGFLISNAVAGAIRSQTRQIGLLRAVGFTNGQLAGVYLGEYLLIGLVSVIVGVASGVPLARKLLAHLTEEYAAGTPLPPVWTFPAALAAVLGLIAVAAAFPLRRISRLDTVTAIRQGTEPPRRRHSRLPRLPFPVAYGLTGLLATPTRTALTALGLAVGALAITVALSLGATVRKFVDDPIGVGFLPNADVAVWAEKGLSPDDLLAAIRSRPDVISYACQAVMGARVQGEEEDIYPRLVCGDTSIYANMLLEGRMPHADDEAAAAYTIAHDHGWRVGDTVTISVKGSAHTFRIVGIYRDMNNVGKMLILPLHAFPGKAPGLFYVLYIRLKPGTDPSAFLADLKRQFGDRVDGQVERDALKSDNSNGNVGGMLVITVTVLSMLLGFLTAVGVLSSLSLSVHEERRTVGILKALGMTPGQITVSVMSAAAAMALAGYVVGAPIGVVTARVLLNLLSRRVGLGPIPVLVSGVGLALLLPGLLLVSSLGAYLPARRAARLQVVEAVREE